MLALVVSTWLCMRLPLYADFTRKLQNSPQSAVPDELRFYLSMADALLHHGVVLYYDANTVVQTSSLSDPQFDLRSLPRKTPDWKEFDYNDWGYTLVVAAAWLLPTAREGVLPIIWLQYVLDLLCLLSAMWFASRLAGTMAAWSTGLIYAVHPALISVINLPAYYFINMFAIVVSLALWKSLFRDEGQGPTRWGLAFVVGLVLGTATLIRATNELLIPLFALFVFLHERISKRGMGLAACLVVGALLPLLPVSVMKYRNHGTLQLAGRQVFWHTVLCGLGAHDNPWGLAWSDELIMERVRKRYGVSYSPDRVRDYEAACRNEAKELFSQNPGIFVRNFFLNLQWGLKFRSVIPPDQDTLTVHKLLNHIRNLTWVGFFCLLFLSTFRPAHAHLKYWTLVLLLLFLYPIAVVAPLVPPNFAYSSGVCGVEAIVGGMGVGFVLAAIRNRWLSLASRPRLAGAHRGVEHDGTE